MMRLQLDRRGTRYERSEAELAGARRHYDRRHWIRLPQFLSPDLFADLQNRLAFARFYERRHTGVVPPSIDLCMEANGVSAMLELITNDRALFDAVREITGCDPIARFSGSVYRLTPGLGHHHEWHDDVSRNRVAAMSINLSPAPYTGGVLQMRDRETERMLDEIANTGPGDAVLFRLSPGLQHRAIEVTEGLKTAFAGWFRTVSPLIERLRELATEGEASGMEPAAERRRNEAS